MILLIDTTNRVKWISYESYKCSGLVCSVLTGKTYAVANRFDCAYALQHSIGKKIRRKLPLSTSTDSKSLFEKMAILLETS